MSDVLGTSATTDVVMVQGGAGDSVAIDLTVWASQGQQAYKGETYNIYGHPDDINAALWVQSNLSVVQTSVVPIALDLNGDGQIGYGHVTMDVNGDGVQDRTAWTDATDGVLVWDKLGDGVVHDNSQYAFSQYGGSTDLEGLAVAFDTNQDGTFNAMDALFAQFAVWQDANQNGVSEAGEVQSLTELGLVEIHLSSDGVQRQPADGVVEAGRTTATLANGTTVLVADAMFAYTEDLRAHCLL